MNNLITDEVWNCKICKKDYSEESDRVVQCEYCSEYYCGKCLSLTKAEYDSFKNPSLHWFCPSCEEKVMKSLRTDREVEQRCSEFMKQMEGRIKTLEDEMKTKVNSNQVKDIVNSVIDKSGSKQTNIDIEKSVEKKVSEIRDSSRREKNIMIHGVTESQDKTPAVRKRADTLFVSELARYLDSESELEGMENVVRIGKKKEDAVRPRPIKVTLNSVDNKKRLMKNLVKLKEANDSSPYYKISVTHDMTQAEREQNKAKLMEARDKTVNDKSGNYTFIVRGPPWARRIVRVPKES